MMKKNVLTGLLLASFLSASALAEGWVQWKPADGGNGHWYKAVVNTGYLTWADSAQIAQGEGGYLATITSAAENNFVFSLINSPEFFSGSGWNGSGPAIGGFQADGSREPDGGWQWLTGEPWNFTSWYPTQPDNGWGTESRLQYWSGTQGMPAPTWNDLNPNDSNLGGYVIERDTAPDEWVQWKTTDGGNGHWYKAVVNTKQLNWTYADQIAQSEGSYLATITSAAENNFVFGLINSPEFFSGSGGNGSGPAIGGFQDVGAREPGGGWHWIGDEPWRFTSWYPSQPDNGWGTESRLQYWSGLQGVPTPTWNDLAPDDSNLGGYILERDKTPESGFYGQVFISGNSFTPVKAMIAVYNSSGKQVRKMLSSPVGQFYAHLPPGTYTVVASLPKTPRLKAHADSLSIRAEVTVEANRFSSVELDF